MPVAIAADIMGGKPKAKRPAKTWQWQDCKDLAKVLNEDWEPKLKITLGRNAILFADGSSFELGKRYGYRNPSQCYEALLSLRRDRLARLSDDGDHPDYCDACHGVGAYCGMCNGAFWDHKEWSQSPDGTWHPAKKLPSNGRRKLTVSSVRSETPI